MDGNSSIVCNDGNWNGRIPACRKTSSKNDFSGEFELELGLI
jgi:hypothetical protein